MSTIPTRASLLAKVHDRQPEAQGEFASIYLPVVTWYASQFTKGHNTDADDIAQDVLVQFGVVNPIQYDPQKGKFRHLLMVAVRRRWLDLMRKRKREGTLPSDCLEGLAINVQDITEKQLLLASVRAVYASVRDDFEDRTRRIFERVHFDGERAVDVAAELGMSEEAVRAATSRVRTRLRAELHTRGISADGIA